MLMTWEVFYGSRNAEDSVTRNGGNKKRFSVSSAYSLLSESAHTPDWSWKLISKTKACYKVTLFTWLVIKKTC